MLPRGLIAAVTIGVMAGAIFGLFFVKIENNNQLEFVEGSSLSIVSEKTDFDLGEEITLKIINSGTQKLTFTDTSYGLQIKGLDGRLLYSPISADVITILEPKEEKILVWSQIKNDGDKALAGTYKITTNAVDEHGQDVKQSITINIHK
jgi:hypothetical protein